MREKLKDKQEEIQETLRNLDKEVKLRYVVLLLFVCNQSCDVQYCQIFKFLSV